MCDIRSSWPLRDGVSYAEGRELLSFLALVAIMAHSFLGALSKLGPQLNANTAAVILPPVPSHLKPVGP